MVSLITATALKLASIEKRYLAMKETLRELTIRRARRILDSPDLPFQPGWEDRKLSRQIREAKQRFDALEKELLSAKSEFVSDECREGQHRRCRLKLRIEGRRLACNCPCHLAR